MKIKLKTYIEELIGDMETPITLFQKYVRNEEGFLLESKEQPKGRHSFIGARPFMVVKAFGEKIIINKEGLVEEKVGRPLDEVKRIIEAYEIINESSFPFVGGAVGALAYDIAKVYMNIPQLNNDNIKTPDLHLLFVKELIVYDHYTNKISILVLEEDNDPGKERAGEKIREIRGRIKKDYYFEEDSINEEVVFQNNTSKKTFMDSIDKIKTHIEKGEISQLVLSQRWSGRSNISPFSLYRRLRLINPSPYMYYFKLDDYSIVGSSPEMLVELKNGKISTCPIAGTRKRGKTDEEDLLLAEDLLNDKKELAEHLMLVEAGKEEMACVSKEGTIKLAKYMEVQKYSHVIHIVSLIEAYKKEDLDMFQVLMNFLPAGTLTGAPKKRAMELIEDLEISKRGIYGGAIGYFGFNNTMDMCIAIRTMIIKDNIIYLQAGAGIVEGSQPEKEYEETINKVKALMAAINNKEEVLS